MIMMRAVTEVNKSEHLSFICTLDGVHTNLSLHIPYCTKSQYVFDSPLPFVCLFVPKSPELVAHLIYTWSQNCVYSNTYKWLRTHIGYGCYPYLYMVRIYFIVCVIICSFSAMGTKHEYKIAVLKCRMQ